MSPIIHAGSLHRRSRNSFFILVFCFFCIAGFIMTACKNVKPKFKASSTFDSVLFKSHRVSSEAVILLNGEYREKIAPESAAESVVWLDDHLAFGKINQEEIAAAILVTETGMGEIYYDLALLKKTTRGWKNTDSVALGDRIKIESVSIKEDEIIVQFLDHGSYDRPCCPTSENIYKYKIAGDRMVKSESEAIPELTGTLWKWRETYYTKNDTYIQPYDSSFYTLQLQLTSGITARADCNTASGEYAIDREYIILKITTSTKAACQPDSLSDKYLADLNSADRYYFKSSELYIVLKNESGVMRFSF